MPPDTRLRRVAVFLERLEAESTTALSLTDFLHALLRALREELRYDSCAAAILDEKANDVLVVRAASGLLSCTDGASIPADCGPWETVLRTGRAVLVSRGEIDAGAGRPRVRCAVYLPLSVRGRPIGVLAVARPRPNTLRQPDLALLAVVARYLAGALEVTDHLHRQLKEISDANPLVGLAKDVGTIEVAHLRAFTDRIETEIADGTRTHGSFTIAAMGPDGDETAVFESGANRVPLRVAEVLAAEMRPADLAIRYGGNGFLLLFAGATALEAQRRLASLGLRRMEMETEDGGPAPLGMAWGTATWPSDGANLESLLDAAERRMYSAMSASRTAGAGTGWHHPATAAAGLFRAVRAGRALVVAATAAVALVTGFTLGASGWLHPVPPQHAAPAHSRPVIASIPSPPMEPALAAVVAAPAPAAPTIAQSGGRISPRAHVVQRTRPRPTRSKPITRYLVVSGPLPEQVAERRAAALLDIGVTPVATIASLARDLAVLNYGEFRSKADAQTLARRVRTAGYTAVIIGQ